MRNRLTVLSFTLASLGLLCTSCGDDGSSASSGTDTDATATGNDTGMICTPGEELPCMCPDGSSGTQTCLAGGGELSACMCEDAQSSSTTDPSTSDATTAVDSSGGPACGDGVLDDGEECDDGDINNGDECLTDCTLPANEVWTLDIDGPASGPDGGSAILVDADSGDLLVVGSEETTDEGSNLWLRRMDADGNEVWTVSWDGGVADDDFGADLAWHPSGDLLVVGSASVNVDNDIDVLAMRVSPADGSVVWSVTHDGDGPDTDDDDSGRGIAADANGNIYVTGQIRTADQLGDVWLAKYDADGVEIWTMPFSGPDARSDAGQDVVVDADGNPIVGGFIGLQGMGLDVWLRKHDPDGVEIWTETHGLLAADQFISALAIDGQGAILAAGFEGDEGGGGGSWLRKYDPDGVEIWTRNSTANGYADVVIGPADEVYAVGSNGVMGQGANAWIRKHDAEGLELWAVSYNGPDDGNDYVSGIALVDGGFVVIGDHYVMGQDFNIWIRRYAEAG